MNTAPQYSAKCYKTYINFSDKLEYLPLTSPFSLVYCF
jgi:hypothetical protein